MLKLGDAWGWRKGRFSQHTYCNIKRIRHIRLNWHKVIRNDCQLVAVDTELVMRVNRRIYEPYSVGLPFLNASLVTGPNDHATVVVCILAID